ncbi:recombinase family protein [uncultured Oscillibacter sp.]|uniref:recombinase family protein n=1 Tax=uncultured Oscillibacter sp. TaxID=876091 RepID=UPI002635A056|nr:recombinase family protein [uncultured Oscillibacter sp.]
MAGNRKLPFGYRMERGEVTENPAEAEAVREIFHRYLAGASYTALVEHLRDAGPAYDGDKPWNKNMVARILENAKYTGNRGFPAVIPAEAFHKAQEQKKTRATPSAKTSAQKELRRLCGGNPPKYVEGQVLGVLNRLMADPTLISVSAPENEEAAQIQALRRKLAELLKEAPVDEDAARRTALDLAAKQLDAIGSEEYETEHLRRVFGRAASLESLDAALLHGSVQKITIRNRRAIVQLKNGQIIKGGSEK